MVFEVVCKVCGKTFFSERYNKAYCSDDCRKAVVNQRSREYRFKNHDIVIEKQRLRNQAAYRRKQPEKRFYKCCGREAGKGRHITQDCDYCVTKRYFEANTAEDREKIRRILELRGIYAEERKRIKEELGWEQS